MKKVLTMIIAICMLFSMCTVMVNAKNSVCFMATYEIIYYIAV